MQLLFRCHVLKWNAIFIKVYGRVQYGYVMLYLLYFDFLIRTLKLRYIFCLIGIAIDSRHAVQDFFSFDVTRVGELSQSSVARPLTRKARQMLYMPALANSPTV